jgi:N-acetylglucosamine-6-phosphate deacetylase
MGAALESDIYCEAVCDGFHLHPASVRLLLKVKGYDSVVAVTDSIMATGIPDGDYVLGANKIVVSGGDATLKNGGVRAGSTLTMDLALRNLVRFTNQPVEKLLPLLTENPAKMIGESENRGTIRTGAYADLVLLDEELTVCDTWVRGKHVYTNKEGDK